MAGNTTLLTTVLICPDAAAHVLSTAPAILFACLVFTLTAPLYIWDIVGV